MLIVISPFSLVHGHSHVRDSNGTQNPFERVRTYANFYKSVRISGKRTHDCTYLHVSHAFITLDGFRLAID